MSTPNGRPSSNSLRFGTESTIIFSTESVKSGLQMDIYLLFFSETLVLKWTVAVVLFHISYFLICHLFTSVKAALVEILRLHICNVVYALRLRIPIFRKSFLIRRKHQCYSYLFSDQTDSIFFRQSGEHFSH